MHRNTLIAFGLVTLGIAVASLTENPFVGVYGIALQSGFETLLFALSGISFLLTAFIKPTKGNTVLHLNGLVFLFAAIIQAVLLSNISFGNSSYISITDLSGTLILGIVFVTLNAMFERKM